MSFFTQLKNVPVWLVATTITVLGWVLLNEKVGWAPALIVSVFVGVTSAVGATAIGAIGGKDEEGIKSVGSNSTQNELVNRAQMAHQRLTELIRTSTSTQAHDYVFSTTKDVEVAVIPRMSDLAERISIIDTTLAGVDLAELKTEQQQITNRLNQTTDTVLIAELNRNAEMLAVNLASLSRLETLRDTLIARMRTAVATLEDLTVRASELIAHGDDPIVGDQIRASMNEITTTLEAARSGLAEAERLTNGTD